MQTQRTALVIGANGGIGQQTCQALLKHGWRVRALVRTAPDARGPVEWHTGDAMNRADVLAAAAGVDVIVHAVNPPGYKGWDRLVLPMLDNTIAAARAQGARIVLPGTIYNYGPDAFPLLKEDSPQHPLTRKGEIRVDMERRLEAASRSGARVLILRCGDFFGPRAGNNWFAQGLMQPGKPVTRLTYPGDYAVSHSWAYLPDVAQTLARLLDREDELDAFERFHFGGHWLDGHAMLAAVRRAAGNDRIKAARFPWWLARLASPFHETMRELCKMRYLWREPVQLDDARLAAFLGGHLYSPLDDAVHATLVANGAIRQDASINTPSHVDA
ncbi:NAD-dependent epimerase/dehydratase family protein [Dyella sp. C11]|uniref:NAD-dependent epimerase/dehydratase family protein n=1 Tax=Dyella sp. C11 TaxID=2126991 RepID=UPI000D64B67B|nr:NAD-dependent epimerase/dehydratase family protein [Dyella sp. C11]